MKDKRPKIILEYEPSEDSQRRLEQVFEILFKEDVERKSAENERNSDNRSKHISGQA